MASSAVIENKYFHFRLLLAQIQHFICSHSIAALERRRCIFYIALLCFVVWFCAGLWFRVECVTVDQWRSYLYNEQRLCDIAQHQHRNNILYVGLVLGLELAYRDFCYIHSRIRAILDTSTECFLYVLVLHVWWNSCHTAKATLDSEEYEKFFSLASLNSVVAAFDPFIMRVSDWLAGTKNIPSDTYINIYTKSHVSKWWW